MEDAIKSVIQNAWMHVACLLFDPQLEGGCSLIHSVVKHKIINCSYSKKYIMCTELFHLNIVH